MIVQIKVSRKFLKDGNSALSYLGYKIGEQLEKHGACRIELTDSPVLGMVIETLTGTVILPEAERAATIKA